jgi:FlaG/FlaF family flagellin (archaellin)
MQTGTSSLEVFDTSLNVIGNVSKSFAGTNPGQVSDIRIGNNQVGADGGALKFENIIIDYTTAVFPLLPTPPIVTAWYKL